MPCGIPPLPRMGFGAAAGVTSAAATDLAWRCGATRRAGSDAERVSIDDPGQWIVT